MARKQIEINLYSNFEISSTSTRIYEVLKFLVYFEASQDSREKIRMKAYITRFGYRIAYKLQ